MCRSHIATLVLMLGISSMTTDNDPDWIRLKGSENHERRISASNDT